MVPKSKILGKPAVIFVTVGSTNFNFNRVFKALDEVLSILRSNPLLIVQKGNSKYRWRYKNVTEHSFLKPNILIEKISQADKIISHAGPGTLSLLSRYSRSQPYIIPRIANFKEHVDNHQMYFVNFLLKKLPRNLHSYFYTQGNLENSLKTYLTKKAQANKLSSFLFKENTFLLDNLDQYIRNTYNL